jgi:hypothetical protein
MVESDEHHTEQSDEAEKRAQRHENLAKSFALALASKTGRSMSESGHVRGAEGELKSSNLSGGSSIGFFAPCGKLPGGR